MFSDAFSVSPVFAVTSLVGVVVVTSAWLWTGNRSQSKPKPRKWVRVGTVKQLMIYPIKSCQGIPVEKAVITDLGLKCMDANIRDRDFLLVDGKGKQLTMINLPKMALITMTVEAPDKLMLIAPEMPNLTFSRPEKNSRNQRTCRCQQFLWQPSIPTNRFGPLVRVTHDVLLIRIKQDASLNVLDCGDDVASWFQTFLNRDDLRLCFHHLTVTQRTFEPFQMQCPQFSKSDFGSFQNATAFMMVAEESVDELNRNLPQERKCTWKSFRPTILINGTSEPFGEVNWSFVKVGNVNTVFNVASPCFRCLLTTVDQKEGILSSNGEPLKTLRSLKISERVVDESVRKMLGSKGVMGLLMGLYRDHDQNQNREGAIISVGDPVYTAIL